MQPLLLLLIVILICIYIQYYYRYPKEIKVINVPINNFDTMLMLEKQPIIVIETTDTPRQFKKKYFDYLLNASFNYKINTWIKNKSKYLLIKSETETELHLLPASKKLINGTPAFDETLITLVLKPDQIVILPFHWYYCSDNSLELLGVNDYISWLLF